VTGCESFFSHSHCTPPDIYFDFYHGSGDLGDSTEYEDDSDEEDDPVSYLLL